MPILIAVAAFNLSNSEEAYIIEDSIAAYPKQYKFIIPVFRHTPVELPSPGGSVGWKNLTEELDFYLYDIQNNKLKLLVTIKETLLKKYSLGPKIHIKGYKDNYLYIVLSDFPFKTKKFYEISLNQNKSKQIEQNCFPEFYTPLKSTKYYKKKQLGKELLLQTSISGDTSDTIEVRTNINLLWKQALFLNKENNKLEKINN